MALRKLDYYELEVLRKYAIRASGDLYLAARNVSGIEPYDRTLDRVREASYQLQVGGEKAVLPMIAELYGAMAKLAKKMAGGR